MFQRIDALVIDDLGYLTLSKTQVELFYNLLNRLHKKTSVIITTHLEFAQWPRIFGDDLIAECLNNLLVGDFYLLRTGNVSYRRALDATQIAIFDARVSSRNDNFI